MVFLEQYDIKIKVLGNRKQTLSVELNARPKGYVLGYVHWGSLNMKRGLLHTAIKFSLVIYVFKNRIEQYNKGCLIKFFKSKCLHNRPDGYIKRPSLPA